MSKDLQQLGLCWQAAGAKGRTRLEDRLRSLGWSDANLEQLPIAAQEATQALEKGKKR